MPASVGSVLPADGASGIAAERPVTVLIDRTDSTDQQIVETTQGDFQAGTLTDVMATGAGALELFRHRIADFESDTIGQPPANWTVKKGTGSQMTVESIDSQKALRFATTSSEVKIISWDDAGTGLDAHLLADFRFASNDSMVGPMVRLQPGTGSTWTGYWFMARYTDVTIAKIVNDGYTSLGSYSMSLSTNTWYRCRCVVSGTSLKWKVWLRSGAEPSSWHVEVTNGDISTAGLLAFRQHPMGGGTYYSWLDNFDVLEQGEYVASGDRVSPAYSLTPVGKAGQAIAEWDATVPANTTLTMEARINGGSWQTLTNGGAIPGISDGDDLTGDTIELRETLETTDDQQTPSLAEVRLIFRAQDATLVEIVVNGVSNTLANGGLVYYGTVNVSGGALVDDHQHVYYETKRRYFTVPGTLTVTVNYNSSTISTTTFTTDPAEQWASYGPGFWTAWTTSPAWLSGAGNGWLAVVDRALSLTGADGWFKVVAGASGLADGYYLVGHMARWIGPEAAALGQPARDVGPGSASLQGWQRGIGPESATLQGWVRPVGQETATLGIVFRDVSPGAAALGIPTRGIAPGSATLYGVGRETSLELEVITEDTQDVLDYLGITVS